MSSKYETWRLVLVGQGHSRIMRRPVQAHSRSSPAVSSDVLCILTSIENPLSSLSGIVLVKSRYDPFAIQDDIPTGNQLLEKP